MAMAEHACKDICILRSWVVGVSCQGGPEPMPSSYVSAFALHATAAAAAMLPWHTGADTVSGLQCLVLHQGKIHLF